MNLSQINSHALSESIMRADFSLLGSQITEELVGGSMQNTPITSSTNSYNTNLKRELRPGKSKFFKKNSWREVSQGEKEDEEDAGD